MKNTIYCAVEELINRGKRMFLVKMFWLMKKEN